MSFPDGSVGKNLPSVQETWVWSLGQVKPLEEEMAAHSSILAWEIPWNREVRQAIVHRLAKSSTRLSDWAHTHIHMHTLEKILESPLDSKEIKTVNPKGNQPWIFIGGTDVEAESLILWPLDMKNWLIWKDPDAGKNWRQKEKGMAEDEMVR